MLRIIIPALLLASPSTAAACDLDGLAGFGGMHRFNPFAGMRSAPASSSAPATAQDKRSGGDDQRKDKRSKTEAASTSTTDEPRKWEVEGGSPVTAEDKATFT